MIVEEYDGAGSGMALGGMIAACLALVVVAIMATAVIGAEPGGSGVAVWFISIVGVAVLVGLLVALLVVGFVVGRATE